MCRKPVQVQVPHQRLVFPWRPRWLTPAGALVRGWVCCIHFYFPTKPDCAFPGEMVIPELRKIGERVQSRPLPARISSPTTSIRHSLPARAWQGRVPGGLRVGVANREPQALPGSPGHSPQVMCEAGGSKSKRDALVLAPSGLAQRGSPEGLYQRSLAPPDRLLVPMWRQPQPLSLLD